jgi:hypothetical protein
MVVCIGLFEFKFDHLNIYLTVFLSFEVQFFLKKIYFLKFYTPSTYKHRLMSKNSKKNKTSHLFYV